MPLEEYGKLLAQAEKERCEESERPPFGFEMPHSILLPRQAQDPIILPRQAQDKHRKSLRNKRTSVLSAGQACRRARKVHKQ